ncbi:MAG: WYL domain-containing protein [Lachnospiraceae bacterium]
MGFIDENGYPLINEEQKIRIALSNRARIIMAEDMDVFGTTKAATFINTVFHNYKSEAKSSISLYLQQREIELDRLFTETKLDSASRKLAIDKILSVEKTELKNQISEYISTKGESKLYHINDNNVEYLLEDCDENLYFRSPGLYMRSIIEEYCSLPFIQRERIFRKNIYEMIEQACSEKRILKIKANYYGKDQLFYVYPYKIVPDQFHTQSYLVCYSRKAEDEEKDKIVASFSMARINHPTMLTKTFHLNKQEIANIESQISNYSPAYLIEKPERIKVKLTKKGKQSYQSRLYSRPEKIESLSTDDVYVFDCTQQQVYNYFFAFGDDAEIISPEPLRNRFKTKLIKSLEKYQ